MTYRNNSAAAGAPGSDLALEGTPSTGHTTKDRRQTRTRQNLFLCQFKIAGALKVCQENLQSDLSGKQARLQTITSALDAVAIPISELAKSRNKKNRDLAEEMVLEVERMAKRVNERIYHARSMLKLMDTLKQENFDE